jgi:hypothetical protein
MINANYSLQLCQVFSSLFELSSGHTFVHTALEQRRSRKNNASSAITDFSDAGKDLQAFPGPTPKNGIFLFYLQ